MSNSKLAYPVQFPLVGLDMRRFLSKETTDDSGAEDDHQQDDFPDQQFLYDLFAVCNHRGSMSNGHYTGKNAEQIISNQPYLS